MSEWITEYLEDVEGIVDGTYCFEEECPPGAQGLAQTEYFGPAANMVMNYGLQSYLDSETGTDQTMQLVAYLARLRNYLVDSFNGVHSP